MAFRYVISAALLTREARVAALFITSGDLIADRALRAARAAMRRTATSRRPPTSMLQAVELAPGFASAWFALGETREALGRSRRRASRLSRRRRPPTRRTGTARRCISRALARPIRRPRTLHAYVRTLFDQYAPRFDRALEDLAYRAPALLRDAVHASTATRFGTMLDLGCGTGLAGAAFRPHVDWLVGVDLSPKMVDEARRKGLYDELAVGDIGQFLADEQAASAFHLVIAADVFAYMADLAEVCAAVARVLAPGGLFGFTVETHDGDGAIVGAKMRYAHGEAFVRGAIADAGPVTLVELTHASSRTENRVPVPGLLVRRARDDKRPRRPLLLCRARPPCPNCPTSSRAGSRTRGWAPRAHQLELLGVARAGRSALLIAPTGAGKTLAGFLPTLVELSGAGARRSRNGKQARSPPAAASAARAGCTRSTSRR